MADLLVEADANIFSCMPIAYFYPSCKLFGYVYFFLDLSAPLKSFFFNHVIWEQ